MEKTYAFLKECGVYFLATADGDAPRVRPFGTCHIFEEKLYIQTGAVKDVSKQMHKNPRVEICACKGGNWLRLSGTAVADGRIEAQESMLEAYPSLKNRYQAGDGNTEVWYLKDARAVLSSFGGPDVVEEF
jgi:uncharacterized pyridoxamine 5'-phosphate oxidase family protein